MTPSTVSGRALAAGDGWSYPLLKPATSSLPLTLLIFLLAYGTLFADNINFSGPIFGTQYSVKARDVQTNGTEQQVVNDVLATIDKCMSTYREDSDVSLFNDSQSTDWFEVSSETAIVVEKAQALSALTAGTFDITVGPLVDLWNFGPQEGVELTLPTEEQIQETLATVGYQKLEVRLDPPALRKSSPKLQIDLSAIAKGHAVDAVIEALPHLENCMVEIGGEVRARGHSNKANEVPWRIGLEAPKRETREVDAIIELENEAMATSGDYRNYFVHEGIPYSHMIDPRTGQPAQHDLASVTILAPDCATADAIATAMMVLGLIEGKTLADEHHMKALFVSRDGDGFKRDTTSVFPKLDIQPTADEVKANTVSSGLGMFLAAGIVFGLAVLAMSLGTIIANRRLQGSCGGMSGLKDAGGKTICDMCTRPSAECNGENAEDMAGTSEATG